jgi:hypothetical protein
VAMLPGLMDAAEGFTSPAAALPQIKEGNVRALAVTSKKRSRILPDVPTMAEAGYPDIEGDSWVGVLVPAGTPKDIIACSPRKSCSLECKSFATKSERHDFEPVPAPTDMLSLASIPSKFFLLTSSTQMVRPSIRSARRHRTHGWPNRTVLLYFHALLPTRWSRSRSFTTFSSG